MKGNSKTEPEPERFSLNFNNTEIAFSSKNDKELKRTHFIFKLMNSNFLVKIFSKVGLYAIRWGLPFSKKAVKSTIFPIFCGGENLLDCQVAIDHLEDYNTLTILDYGAEGKSTESELDVVLEENIKAVEMAASNNSVPVISVKITGLVDNIVLEKLDENIELNEGEKRQYDLLLNRLNKICERAEGLKVGVFIDAEESWIQRTIDKLALDMMLLYNKEQCIVYNTYQLYRHDKLEQLKNDHQWAQSEGLFFGAKIVRGAYMEKERNRAEELSYPSPIQKDKESTDKDFNLAIDYCIHHYETISLCCASHNLYSNEYQARLIHEAGLDKSHPHLNFCQLYGMSDYITFNLAEAGYNVAKYVPYGPVKEVIPYLIRRAQENASITGEMSRELSLIDKEIGRRGLQ